MRDSGDFGILLGYTFHCVNHHQNNICSFYRGYGPDNTVPFQLFLDLALSAKTCCINEYILFSVMNNLRINSIPCCPCNIRYNDTVLPEKFIDDGGFSDIWFSDNGNPRSFVLLLFFVFFREIRDNCVQKVSDSKPGGCRYRIRVSDSKIIKFVDVRHKFVKIIYLVHCKNHRLFRAAQHICNLGVCIYKPLSHICNKNNHICRIYRNLRLLPHL